MLVTRLVPIGVAMEKPLRGRWASGCTHAGSEGCLDGLVGIVAGRAGRASCAGGSALHLRGDLRGQRRLAAFGRVGALPALAGCGGTRRLLPTAARHAARTLPAGRFDLGLLL